ncbi:MAG: hypothetical protein ACPGUV_08650 [Polyangiales bacterium]
MLIALTVWLLDLFGVAPSPETLENYATCFRERGHHIGVDFASTRAGLDKLTTLGFGYEYLIDRSFHGVSFEVLGQLLGSPFKGGDKDGWVGGGLGYYPIRNLKFFMQAGALLQDEEDPGPKVQVRGRIGVGYRLMFFAIGAMPFFYAETTSTGLFTWSLGARLQY